MNDNELMNRRRFFKKTAKEILPMLGTFVVAPTVIMTTLTACPSDVCDGCEAACRDNCVDSCKGNCYTACANSSAGGDCSDCSSTCSNSSTSNSCSSCANNCSSSCTGTCSDSCEGSCSETCQGQCSKTCNDTCSSTCKETCTSSSNNNQSGSANGADISDASGSISGYEYVDLGLSVKWARYNMGATKPEEKGDFYYWVSYGSDKTMYFTNMGQSLSGKSICGTKYDTARSKWGNKWQMPSKKDFEELFANCQIETFICKGVTGLKATSKKNGNSIFLPCAGYLKSGISYSESSCFYWTGDIQYLLGGWLPEEVYYLCYYNSSSPRYDTEDVYNYDKKMNIRPVTGSSSGSDNGGSSCTSCGSGCSTGCTGACGSGCSSSCTGGCDGGCYYGCSGSCGTGCGVSCSGGCDGTCTGSCSGRCRGLNITAW